MRKFMLCAVALLSFLLAAGVGAQSATKPKAGKDAGAQPALGKPLNIPPDAAREQAVTDAISRRVPANEVVLLDVEKSKVIALYSEQTSKKARGAVLLLHGMDRSADDAGVMHALRTELPKSGWSTLALQLPLLPPGSPREAYGGTQELAQKRIKAALAKLAEKKPISIAIVGQELGGALAINSAVGVKEIKAVAALSLSSADGLNPPAEVTAAIEKLKIPTLELYGALDTPANIKRVEQRAATARTAEHPDFTQVALVGRNDQLDGDPLFIVTRLRSWLARHVTAAPAPPVAAGTAQPAPAP